MNGKLAGLGDECEAFDSHNIADVEKFLEDGVVHCLVLSRADFVPVDIYLDSAVSILESHE